MHACLKIQDIITSGSESGDECAAEIHKNTAPFHCVIGLVHNKTNSNRVSLGLAAPLKPPDFSVYSNDFGTAHVSYLL